MTPEQLQEILGKHGKWIRGEVDGVRANLYGANLYGANLDGANLTWANLYGANLARANLTWANLTWANLTRANLDGANLTWANLDGANLTWANLTWANLDGANLTWANLYGANLARANLYGAKIQPNTNLTGEPWSDYLSTVVPALLTAGGKTPADIAASGCWDCHEWSNCPMHVAYGIDSSSKGPLLLRPRIEQFVQLFDAKLIPFPWPELRACAAPESQAV